MKPLLKFNDNKIVNHLGARIAEVNILKEQVGSYAITHRIRINEMIRLWNEASKDEDGNVIFSEPSNDLITAVKKYVAWRDMQNIPNPYPEEYEAFTLMQQALEKMI